MNLRQKILLLASAPMIIVVSAIILIVTFQAKSLSEEEITSFERSMLAAKKSGIAQLP